VIAPRLVTAGRLDLTKGHDILIEATARLVKEWPEVSLTILGEGACRPNLEALAGTLGIADRVRFAGVTPRPEPLLAESDVFCFPSRSEAQGLALIEALAAGLPVVASAVGGILETVAPEETGLLVEPGNAAALADAIARLARDHELRSRLATTARERVSRWDVSLAARAYLALYEDVLGAGATESGAADRPGSARA
jgi:glycosyltransferase involved in cell wall biosynthesis